MDKWVKLDRGELSPQFAGAIMFTKRVPGLGETHIREKFDEPDDVYLSEPEAIDAAKRILVHYGVPFCNRVPHKREEGD